MTTAQIQHPTEAICPPWCAGHLGAYQGWETLSATGLQIRDHADHGATIGDITIEVAQVERGDHTLEPPVVSLYDAGDRADLPPSQARQIAALLVEAADRAEAQR